MQGTQQEGSYYFRIQEFWRGWLLKWGLSPFLVILETRRIGFSLGFFGAFIGKLKERERRETWEELALIKGLWDVPWCIVGDFNVVRFPVEKGNCNRLSATMRQFSNFIDELNL